METLKNYTLWETIKKWLVTTGLASTLLFWTASCGKTTPEDVNQQRQNVEIISHQINSYIDARKDAVEKYNRLYKYPKKESNRYSIEKVKADLYKSILSYNEKIEDLASDKIKAEEKVSEKMANCIDFDMNTWPLDPNKYDFLLDF